MSYTVASILPRAAARLNDYAQEKYTNAKLLPFAQDAADLLQIELELNGILALEKLTTTPITITAGWTEMASHSVLPTDMLEPQKMDERQAGSQDRFVEMIPRQWEPDLLPTDSLRYWAYREQNIFFPASTQARQVRIYYLKRALNITSVGDTITINNSQQFMITCIAGLAATYIGENPTRGAELEQEAKDTIDKVIRIGVKNKQRTRTRRRPFVLIGRRN